MSESTEESNKKSLSQSLYRAEQVRSGEQQAAEKSGLSMRALMAAAGRAVFEQLQQMVPSGASVAVFCGEGNNGGDGYVIARLASQQGYRVTVYALNPGKSLQHSDDNDAEHARQAWRELGGTEQEFDDFTADRFDLIVDAVFGIGLNRPLEGKLERWVQCVNQSQLPVLAVDVPSGLDADTGKQLGATIMATNTVTMVARKRGLYSAKGPALCGDIILADLGVGDAFSQANASSWQLLDKDVYYPWLGARRRDAHKGDFGHVLVIGGNAGMSGAATLAMQAALRSGAGKVSVACHPQSAPIIAVAQPEAMVHGIQHAEELEPLLEQASIIVLGPGLGQTDWSLQLFNQVMKKTARITVIDADGLNLMAKQPDKSDRFIITPHPGEAARLLQCSGNEVEQDRFAAVKLLRQRFGGQALLKGAGSLIASDRGNFVIGRGSPALASGGMGDCLAGLIGGLLGQQLAPAQALIAASFWHAVAGEHCAKSGERGTLASDLLVPIRRLVNGLPIE
ncbi:MAG: bifunctional ADP-dependent NAD(P)H-hydrate dehydratase/NAD(P)H-hydrate epimerase [Idiomarina sp.]|nr:bifunctional ADP-dependent NAD(P)H-hydrate dehydratase/NAD(P)H-hydrate epimerase [Idiomarina sp.]